MLRSISEVMGYRLQATDGDIGHCRDFLFDDRDWTIRYMVADTGNWLSGRQVLISPISLDHADWRSRRLITRLDRRRIESAPDLDEHAPVSRQYERAYHEHYGWPIYWGGAGVWAAGAFPEQLYDAGAQVAVADGEEQEDGDPHLRSVAEVREYAIRASDGPIGRVSDFIMDDASWTIRYLVADTHKWRPGKRVLVSPRWVQSVDWGESDVRVDLTRKALKNSPEFDPDEPVNRDYEVRLFDYYGRPHYW